MSAKLKLSKTMERALRVLARAGPGSRMTLRAATHDVFIDTPTLRALLKRGLIQIHVKGGSGKVFDSDLFSEVEVTEAGKPLAEEAKRKWDEERKKTRLEQDEAAAQAAKERA